MSISTDYNEILKVASRWSAEQRASLAHDLLELPAEKDKPAHRRPSFSQALGLGRGEETPPNPEQVKRQIHAHWLRKYGK